MGLDPASWAMIIAAGAQLTSSAMSARDARNAKAKPTKTVANPNFDAQQQRYLAVIDKYMEKKGIKPKSYTPANTPAQAAQAQPAPAPTPAPAPAQAPQPQAQAQAPAPAQAIPKLPDPKAQAAPAPTPGPQTVPINRLTRTETGSAPAMPKIVEIDRNDPVDNSSVYAAGANAIGQLGGQLIASQINKPSSGNQPTAANPYYDQAQSRFQGIYDAALAKNGIDTSKLPAYRSGQFPTSAPAQTLPGTAVSALPTGNRGTSIGQTRTNRAAFVGAVNASSQQDQQKPIQPIAEENYNNAAFAAKVGARRLGMSEDPKLETTRDFHEQDQAQKQEELNKLYNYIYGQSSMRL